VHGLSVESTKISSSVQLERNHLTSALGAIPSTSGTLEHLIFRGSHRYPVTNLYSSLVQTTLLTGLNASTLADTTLYHLSSCNGDDFSNLVDVLMDAVFHPHLLEEDIFQEREVVVNEMIGHHAVAQHQVLEKLRSALLPETVYALDWNGAPELVGQLTPEALRDFHSAHYCAEKARIFLWGDFDVTRQLDQLDRLLVPGPCPEAAHLSLQLRRPDTFNIDATFSTSQPSRPATGFGWAFELKNIDLWEALALGLFHAPDGALREILTQAGGRAVGAGFTADKPFGTFEVAVLGHSKEATDDLGEQVIGKLFQLAQTGVSHNQSNRFADLLEMDLRRLGRKGRGPQGLRALELILGRWRHGADPLAQLDISTRIADLRETLNNPQAVRNLLERDLLGNPHRVVLSAEPVMRLNRGEWAAQTQRVVADPTAKTARIDVPFVDLEASGFEVRPSAVNLIEGVLHVSSPMIGCCSAELAISLSGLDADEVGLLPALTALLSDGSVSGTLDISACIRTAAEIGERDGAWLFLSGRSLPSQSEQLVEGMQAALSGFAPRPDQIVGKINAYLSRQTAALAAVGHLFAETRVRALASSAGRLEEVTSGLSSVAALKRLLKQDPETLADELVRLALRLSHTSRWHIAVSGVEPYVAGKLLDQSRQPVVEKVTVPVLDLPMKEGIATLASNFTAAQAFPLEEQGGARVIAHLLETGWLWDSVRVAGGAYSVRGRFSFGDGFPFGWITMPKVICSKGRSRPVRDI